MEENNELQQQPQDEDSVNKASVVDAVVDSVSVAAAEFKEGFVGGLKVIPASIRRTGTIYNASEAAYREAVRLQSSLNGSEPEFDINAEIEHIPEELRDKYLWCRSREDIDTQSGWISQETEDNELYEKYPAASILADLAVGVVEGPLIAIGKTKTIWQIVKATTKATAVNVAARYANQDLMSTEQAVVETVAAPILGTMFGIGAKVLPKAKRLLYLSALSDNLTTDFAEHQFVYGKGGVAELAPTASGEYKAYSLEDMHPTIQKIVKFNPILQGLTSESEVLRKFTDSLFNHNFVTSEVNRAMDRPASVQAGIFVRKGIEDQYIRDYLKIAKDFLKQERSTFDDFSRLVVQEIRNPSSSNNHVKSAAKVFREYGSGIMDDAIRYRVFGEGNPRTALPQGKVLTKEEAFSGVISPNSDSKKFADGYFPRMYDKRAITENPEEFKGMLSLSIQKNNPKLGSAEGIVEEVYDSISGNRARKLAEEYHGRERIYLDDVDVGSIKKGVATDRKVLIEDAALEEFLINDPVQAIKHIGNQLNIEIEMNRVAQENGYTSFSGFADELLVERRNAVKGLSGEALRLVEEKYDKYARFIEDSEKLVRGTYDRPESLTDINIERLSNTVKTLNYMAHLGGVAISAITEAALTVNKFGFFRSVKSMFLNAFGNSTFKANKADLAKFGAASEACALRQANRYLDQSDIGNASKSMFDIGLEKTTNVFTKVSLLPYIDDFNRTIAGTLHGTDIIEAIISNDAKFLSEARISKKYWGPILEQFNKHEGRIDESGLAVFDTSKWTHKEATHAFRSSVISAGRNVCLKPSAGEVPKVLHSKWGRIFSQYQSYEWALLSNVIAQWANGQRKNIVPAVGTMLGLGYVAACLKSLNSGDPYKHIDDPDLHLKALECSGVLPVILRPAVAIAKGAYNFVKPEGQKNTHDNESIMRKISPQIAAIDNAWSVAQTGLEAFRSYLNEEEHVWGERELRSLKGLMPFCNCIWVNAALNGAIRNHVEDSGGRLMKTREEKYWENKE